MHLFVSSIFKHSDSLVKWFIRDIWDFSLLRYLLQFSKINNWFRNDDSFFIFDHVSPHSAVLGSVSFWRQYTFFQWCICDQNKQHWTQLFLEMLILILLQKFWRFDRKIVKQERIDPTTDCKKNKMVYNWR